MKSYKHRISPVAGKDGHYYLERYCGGVWQKTGIAEEKEAKQWLSMKLTWERKRRYVEK